MNVDNCILFLTCIYAIIVEGGFMLTFSIILGVIFELFFVFLIASYFYFMFGYSRLKKKNRLLICENEQLKEKLNASLLAPQISQRDDKKIIAEIEYLKKSLKKNSGSH